MSVAATKGNLYFPNLNSISIGHSLSLTSNTFIFRKMNVRYLPVPFTFLPNYLISMFLKLFDGGKVTGWSE